ncbi:MAG: hypothetical protein U9N34_09475, partial [Candidatus Cloacimonadota bacterium]|nr:hypothetical protein [Candidatus Cloacimonadota bacterium]
TYKPRNIMKTVFNCDAELVQFDEVNDLFENKFNFYLGVEHQFMKKLPFRFGFNFQNFYQIIEDDGIIFAENFAMPTFSLGTGFKILDNLDIDVSVEIAKREYDTLDLFPDSFYAENGLYDSIEPEDRGWENPDHVNEKFIKFQTSINYKW